MGKFSVRLCASALVLLVAISTIVSVVTPFEANAAPVPPGGGGSTTTTTTPVPTTDPATLYLAPEVLADATASEYRTSLVKCLVSGGGANLADGYGDTLSANHALNGPWFNGDNFHPGILVWKNANDYISCYDLMSYNPAKGLGISDNITLACDIGLVRTDGKDCLTDPDQSDFTDKNINGDKNKAYANLDAHRTNASAPPTGGWNDAQRYVDVMATLTKFCNATATADVGGPLATPPVLARDHDTAYSVVDGNGDITKVYYDVPDHGKKAKLMDFEDNFNWWEESCAQLTKFSDQYAPAYAAYVKANPQTTDSGTGGTTTGSGTPDKSSCIINGIGWIVCPVMRFMSQITDQAYSIVTGLLTTPALDPSTSSAMYQAWSIMRNFANVAFIIAFLFIVYSQISGVGISNYGIKRMLPRIIVAAILANVSYWICAVAIDISNILGTSMAGLFNVPVADLSKGGASVASSGAGGGWDALTVTAITGVAGVALLYVGLSVLVPLLLAALVAIVTTVIALTVRQAVDVLLVAISSLAFVAYILPNTEPLFHRWRKIFQAMLIVFPAVGMVFGASNLASAILDAPGAPFLLQIIGAGVKVVPLFIVPFMIKGATSVLGKVGGWINNPNKGPVDRLRRGAEGYRNNRQEYRKLKALNGERSLPGARGFIRRGERRKAVLANRKGELNRASSDYIAGLAKEDEGFRAKLAQGGGAGASQRALATAINVQASLRADEVKAEHANIKEANIDGAENLMKLINGETVNGLKAAPGSALQTAAIEQLAKTGDVSQMDKLISMSGSMGVQQRQAIAEGMRSMSGKVKYYGGGAAGAVAAGDVKSEGDLNKLVADSVEAGKYGVEELQNGDHDAMTRVADVIADPNSVTSDKVKADGTIEHGKQISGQKKDDIRAAATELRTNDNLKKPSPRVQDRLLAIEHGVAYTNP